MNISDELKAYMEQEFHKMVKDGNKLQDEREKYKKEWDKKRQRIEDERDKKLKALSRLKDTIDNEQQYQSLKNRIIQESKSLKRKEGTVKENPLKGKATPDLNNFLCACYYLIKKENPESKDSEIYRLIEQKLAEHEFKARGKTAYDYDNIREKISEYKKMPDNEQTPFNQLFERSYNRFLKNAY